MDYGALVSRAWNLTWRHKFLWILGLFATSTVGSCASNAGSSSNWNTSGREVDRAVPGASSVANEAGAWIMQNFGLITAVVIVAVLLGVAIAVVSLIAQGAMAQATSDVARGRPSSLGQAWAAGMRLFWRYLGLWLMLLVLGIAVAVVVAILAALFFAGAIFGGNQSGPFVIVGALLGGIGALIAIPVGIGLTIVVAYAQRAIAVEDVGPWEGLGAGWRLLRRRFGTSLVVWLISLALSIGAAFVMAIVAVILAIPLGGIGLVLWFSAGVSAATFLYVALAVVAFVVALWFVGGILNTYFWNLWTLVYLHLTGRMEPEPAAPPPAA